MTRKRIGSNTKKTRFHKISNINMAYLTFNNEKTNKFWAAKELEDGKILAQYGKINSNGVFTNYLKTKKLDSLISSKIKKGYTKQEEVPSISLFRMSEVERLAMWNNINNKKMNKKKTKTMNNEKKTTNNSKKEHDDRRKARFFNIAEEITPYYYHTGVINKDFEYAAYLLELQKNGIPSPSMTKSTHRVNRFDFDKNAITEEAVEKRVQKCLNSSDSQAQIGDIFFIGTVDDDRSEYPIQEELTVLDENRQLVPLNRFHSSDFKVNYSGIISEVNDFCALEMEGWDEYYETPEDKPFYKFLKV